MNYKQWDQYSLAQLESMLVEVEKTLSRKRGTSDEQTLLQMLSRFDAQIAIYKKRIEDE